MNMLPAKFAALTLAVGLALLPSASRSSSVIGATEPTQIANNVELVAQYLKQVEQAATQLKQYQAQLEQFRQLDPQKLLGMLKGVGGGDVMAELERRLKATSEADRKLMDLAGNMRTLYGEGMNLTDVMRHMNDGGVSASASDILTGMRQLAEQRQGGYQARLDAITRAIEDAKNDIARVRAIADTSPDITTNAQGFGALLQSSAVMSGQLGGLQQALLAQASMQTTAQAEAAEARDEERQSRVQGRLLLNEYLGTPSSQGAEAH